MSYSTWTTPILALAFSAYVGPVMAQATSNISILIDQMWTALLGTTITGKEYARRGQPDTGKWAEAKRIRDQIKGQT